MSGKDAECAQHVCVYSSGAVTMQVANCMCGEVPEVERNAESDPILPPTHSLILRLIRTATPLDCFDCVGPEHTRTCSHACTHVHTCCRAEPVVLSDRVHLTVFSAQAYMTTENQGRVLSHQMMDNLYTFMPRPLVCSRNLCCRCSSPARLASLR